MRTVPLSEAKDKLSALVEEADTTHEGRVVAIIDVKGNGTVQSVSGRGTDICAALL